MDVTNLKSGDIESLQSRLRDLEIIISEIDGGFNVASNRVPLFCFDRSTVEEIQETVRATLVSYISTFYHVNLEISVERRPIPESIPVRRVEPVGYLKPIFDLGFANHRDFAIA